MSYFLFLQEIKASFFKIFFSDNEDKLSFCVFVEQTSLRTFMRRKAFYILDKLK